MRIKEVRFIGVSEDRKVPVYDLILGSDPHNFKLGCGIFVHNSNFHLVPRHGGIKCMYTSQWNSRSKRFDPGYKTSNWSCEE